MDAQASYTGQHQDSHIAHQTPTPTPTKRQPAVIAMVLAAGASAIGALAVLADPMSPTKHQLVRNTERDTGVTLPLSAVDEQSSEAQDLEFIYTVLATNTLLWAAALVLLTMIIRRGKRITRAFAYVVLVCTALAKLLHTVVYFPGVTVICDIVAAGAALTACFLLPRMQPVSRPRGLSADG